MDDAVHIPLRARDGSIRAYAVVDAADAEWVNRWRWSLSADGYAYRVTTADGRKRKVRLHRVILGLTRGDGYDGDHINRDRLNNRRSNLRKLGRGENAQNQTSARGASSGFRGVSWDHNSGKWRASIRVDGRLRHLGRFVSEIEAAAVARKARLQLMPFTVEEQAVAS